MQDKSKELAALLAKECGSVAEVQSALRELFSGTLEQMFEAELDEHLGYEKNSVLGNNSGRRVAADKGQLQAFRARVTPTSSRRTA